MHLSFSGSTLFVPVGRFRVAIVTDLSGYVSVVRVCPPGEVIPPSCLPSFLPSFLPSISTLNPIPPSPLSVPSLFPPSSVANRVSDVMYIVRVCFWRTTSSRGFRDGRKRWRQRRRQKGPFASLSTALGDSRKGALRETCCKVGLTADAADGLSRMK